MPLSPGSKKKAQVDRFENESSDTQMEQVFSLLNIAIKHEDDGDNAQAYDNYMHAVTIMEEKVSCLENEHRQNVEETIRKSPSRSPRRKFHRKHKSTQLANREQTIEQLQWEFENRSVVPLLREKIQHYSMHADDLIQRSSSTTSSSARSSRNFASAPDLPVIPFTSFECDQDINSPKPDENENENKNYVPKIVNNISEEHEETKTIIKEYTAKSNAALSMALSLDGDDDASGALDHYIEAIEWEFKALKQVKEHKRDGTDKEVWESMEQNFTKRLSDMMSRAEKLKTLIAS